MAVIVCKPVPSKVGVYVSEQLADPPDPAVNVHLPAGDPENVPVPVLESWIVPVGVVVPSAL